MTTESHRVGFMCAWRGCAKTFAGDMPPGWISLVTFWAPRGKRTIDFLTDRTERDAVLCPEHHEELEGYHLKNIR